MKVFLNLCLLFVEHELTKATIFLCPSFHLLQKKQQNLNIHLHVVGDNFTIYKVFMHFQTQSQVCFTLKLFLDD